MSLAGIDVSAAQGRIDWKGVASARVDGRPLRFAFAKASEGPRYVDPRFFDNWTGARSAGLRRGAYHFARPENGPPEAQAEQLARVLDSSGGLLRGDMPPALDVEEARGVENGEPFVRWVLGFLVRLEALTGRVPLVYTGGPFFDQHDGTPSTELVAALRRYPLWLAAYVRSPDDFLPPEWRGIGWTFWQRSGDVAAPGFSPLHLPGIAGNVDRDEFRGDDAALDALIAGARVAFPVEAGLTLGTPNAPATTLADEAHRLPSLWADDSDPPDTLPDTQAAKRKSSDRLRAVDPDATLDGEKT